MSTTNLPLEYDPEFGMGDQMFTDLQLSRDLMKEFSAIGNNSDYKVSVMVLQHSVWPFAGRKKDLALPEWVYHAYTRITQKAHYDIY